MDHLRLSIVIPVLDDADALRLSLPRALDSADQVVVVDGGSSDDSCRVARELGAVVVESAAGRGVQLNRGAEQADGEVLIFLHADSELPADARSQIESAIADGYQGGGSQIRFDVAGPLLRFGAGWINSRTRLTRLPLGDQAQFVTSEAFADVGGFNDWPILEDLDFMRRLKRSHRVAVLPGPVITSSRRFRRLGSLKTITINWAIWTLYAAGMAPERLSRWYRKVR